MAPSFRQEEGESVLKYHTVGRILKYHTVGTVLKSNRKFVERDKIDNPSIYIYKYIYMIVHFPAWYRHLYEKWRG
jgi:hypothetical protein